MTTKRHKVLLIIPIPSSRYNQFTVNYYSPNIGLASIAGYLIAKKIEAEIFDGILDSSLINLYKKIESYAPTHIGITAFTSNIKSAWKTAEAIKKKFSQIPITIGGIHVSALPEESLAECPYVDYVIIGEGEESFYALLENIDTPQNFHQIRGLGYRRNSKIIINPPSDHYHIDMDTLPMPAWHLFDLKKYKEYPFRDKTINSNPHEFLLQTTRGCPYLCKFCSRNFGNNVRQKSPSIVVEEISVLINSFNAKYLLFADETFTINKKYTQDLCHLIINRGLDKKIAWSCATRVDKLDEKILSLMKNAGCVSIFVGLESGSQKILNLINKDIQTKDFIGVLNNIKEQGISTVTSFILGFPSETTQDIKKTIKVSLALPLDFASFNIFTPFPGSEFYKTLSTSNIITLKTHDWDRYVTQTGSYQLNQRSIRTLDIFLLHNLAYLRFYLRKNYFYKIFQLVNIKILFYLLINSITRGIFADPYER